MHSFITITLMFFFSISGAALAAGDDIIEIESEGSYTMEANSSVDIAKAVAFFTAQRNAVNLAGRYFSSQSLIEAYTLEKDEIYSLTARKIQTQLLGEDWVKNGAASTYRVRIRARIEPSDFVKAEMEAIKQEKQEKKESYREEMEQPVSAEIDPGKEIAIAYQMLRENKWRITMIYLDHLEKKYPNWDRIYMAKAITHYNLREPVFMEKDLSEACRLGNNTACSDLRAIKTLHGHDFGLSIID